MKEKNDRVEKHTIMNSLWEYVADADISHYKMSEFDNQGYQVVEFRPFDDPDFYVREYKDGRVLVDWGFPVWIPEHDLHESFWTIYDDEDCTGGIFPTREEAEETLHLLQEEK